MHNKALGCAIFTYDGLLFELSMSFINIEIGDIDFNIMNSLEKISKYLNADRAYLFTYDYTHKITTNTHEWCNQGIPSQIQNLQNIPIDLASDWIERHEKGEIVFIEDIQNISSSPLKDVLLQQEIKSMVAIPMLYKGVCLGFVGFDFVKNYHKFNDEETKLFSLFAKLLVNVHDKIKIEKALRDSEQHYRTLANGGMALIWTSDTDKLCNYFNEPWLRFTGRKLELRARKWMGTRCPS